MNYDMFGRGKNRGNRAGAGPGGKCYCEYCRRYVKHQRGVPCYKMQCPFCGERLKRA